LVGLARRLGEPELNTSIYSLPLMFVSVWGWLSPVSRLKFEDPYAGVNILIINSYMFLLSVENKKSQNYKNMKEKKKKKKSLSSH